MNLFPLLRATAIRALGLLVVLTLVLPNPAYGSPVRQEAVSAPAPALPALSSIQLESSVRIANQVATYTLYPTNTARQSAWNVQMRLPLPANATLVKSGATPPFATTFDGEAVIFYAAELGSRTTGGPLVFQLALSAPVTTPLTIEPELSWQTLRTVMRQSELFAEAAPGAQLAIQPDLVKQTFFDAVGDVPEAGYDMTGITLAKEGASLKIDFATAGVLGTSSQALEFYLYLDSDCNSQTGRLRAERGLDYRVRYRHGKAQADISDWLPTVGTDQQGDWGNARSVGASASTDGTMVTVWVPMIAFQEDRFFCWFAESQRKTDATAAKLPKDELPDFTKDPRLAIYQVWDEASGAFVTEPLTTTASYTESSPGELLWAGLQPFSSTVVSPSVLSGKIAVPLVNSQGQPEVQIWTIADLEAVRSIANAHQPDFRQDGARLLINRTDGTVVYEYDLTSEQQVQVSAGVAVAQPTYNPTGDRVAYAGTSTSITTTSLAPIYVQCSLTVPDAETDEGCRKLTELGRLAGNQTWGDIVGSDPLWSVDDQIIYRACPVWDGYRRCGIYSIAAGSTLSSTVRSVPIQLVDDPSAIPTDLQEEWLTFMAERAGNWEVYVMRQDGSWLQNLSNASNAQDGLPTFAPDGHWVAFVSNRDGEWAIWAVPVQGGKAQKLFDLPGPTLWDQGTQSWAAERISWGP